MKALAILAGCVICTVTALDPINLINDGISKIGKIVDDMMETFKDLYYVNDDGNIVPIDVNDLLPETLNETEKDLPNRVFFYLYTRKNAKEPQKLYIDDVTTLKNSNFDMQKETKFVTHGWFNTYLSPACTLIRDAFLQNSDCNVIVIDWSMITMGPYIWASDRVLIVGKFASKMVSFLESQGLDENKLTIVGHSLGAHVARLTSYYATRKANYVVGLDPAQPNFHNVRFAAGQGKFVEIIHSNAALWGLDVPIGDADFWPNGGRTQPGCANNVINTCSHARSYEYFAESINSKIGFVGVQCDSYENFLEKKCVNNSTAMMGGVKPQAGVRGNYYLKTNDHAQFARGSRS